MDPYSYGDADPYQDVDYAPVSNPDEKSQARSSLVAVAASVIGLLCLIVLVVLSWLIWRHLRNTKSLWHAITVIIALLFMAFCAFWAFQSRAAVSIGSTPNVILSVIVYVGGALFAAYFLTAAMILWCYKCFHNASLYHFLGNPEQWKKWFGNRSIETLQKHDSRMYLVICVSCVIVAICFGLLSYIAYSYMANYVQSAKILLMISLIGIVTFGFLGLYLSFRSRDIYQLLASYFPSIHHLSWFFVLVFGFVLAAAVTNAILNVIRRETGYFLIGVVWIFIGLILLFGLGLLFRDLRFNVCHNKDSNPKTISCRMAADIIPAKHYKGFCPTGKYLAHGQTCRKADLTIEWEKINNPEEEPPQVFLNPACCGVAGAIAVWPFFIIGVMGLCTVAFICLAVIANFGQCEFESTYDEYFRNTNYMDLATLAIILLAVLGVSLLFMFKRPHKFETRYGKIPPPGFIANPDGSLAPTASFVPVVDPVIESLVQKPIPYGCYPLESQFVPRFVTGDCKNFQVCGLSVGLLATHSSFMLDHYSGSAFIGPRATRSFFFPNSYSSKDDFIHLYGTADQINESVRQMVVCQTSPLEGGMVYAHAITTDVGYINDDTLTGGVKTKTFDLIADAPSARYPDYPKMTICPGYCQVAVAINSINKIDIVGNLLVKNQEGNLVNYGIPESGVEIAYGRYINGKFNHLSFGTYDQFGRFSIKAPLSSAVNYIGTIKIVDNDKMYRKNEIDVLLTQPKEGSNKLFVGDVILMTDSGVGCKVDNLRETLRCIEQQKVADFLLELEVLDSTSSKLPAADVKYTIRRTYSAQGEVVHGPEHLKNGKLSIWLPPGYYNIELSGKNFVTKSEPLLIDQPRKGEITLTPVGKDEFNIYMNVDNTIDPNYDYDLNLKMVTADGSTCTINSFNRVCPYAQLLHDVGPGERGIETIRVNKLLNANYMVYVSKGPAYMNCPQAAALPKWMLSESHLLAGFFSQNPIYSIYTNYFGKAFGGSPYSVGTGGSFMGLGSSVFSGLYGNGLTGGIGGWAGFLAEHGGAVGGLGRLVSGGYYTFLPQNYIASFVQDLPIKIGAISNVPLIFSAIKQRNIASNGQYIIPEMNALYSLYDDNPGKSSLFVQCMPMIYTNENNQIADWIKYMVKNNVVSKAAVPGFLYGEDMLVKNKFMFSDQSVTTLFGQIIELELVRQQKLVSQDNALFTSSLYYEQLFKNSAISLSKETEISGPQIRFKNGIGEEPYLLSTNFGVNKTDLIINDHEVGLEDIIATAPYPMYSNNVTFQVHEKVFNHSSIGLIGVEIDGQISIYEGNSTQLSPAAYPRNWNDTNFKDLSDRVPKVVDIGYAVRNSTTTYYTWIIPTSDGEIAQYLQDQQGLIHIYFRNGTILFTNAFNETVIKHVTHMVKQNDGSRIIVLDDGSTARVYLDNTMYTVGQSRAWVKTMFPVNTTVLLASIHSPIKTRTTSYIVQTVTAGKKIDENGQVTIISQPQIIVPKGNYAEIGQYELIRARLKEGISGSSENAEIVKLIVKDGDREPVIYYNPRQISEDEQRSIQEIREIEASGKTVVAEKVIKVQSDEGEFKEKKLLISDNQGRFSERLTDQATRRGADGSYIKVKEEKEIDNFKDGQSAAAEFDNEIGELRNQTPSGENIDSETAESILGLSSIQGRDSIEKETIFKTVAEMDDKSVKKESVKFEMKKTPTGEKLRETKISETKSIEPEQERVAAKIVREKIVEPENDEIVLEKAKVQEKVERVPGGEVLQARVTRDVVGLTEADSGKVLYDKVLKAPPEPYEIAGAEKVSVQGSSSSWNPFSKLKTMFKSEVVDPVTDLASRKVVESVRTISESGVADVFARSADTINQAQLISASQATLPAGRRLQAVDAQIIDRSSEIITRQSPSVTFTPDNLQVQQPVVLDEKIKTEEVKILPSGQQYVDVQEIKEEIIEARAIPKIDTAGANDLYAVQFCFTGLGPRSIRALPLITTTEPSIDRCRELYGDIDVLSQKLVQ